MSLYPTLTQMGVTSFDQIDRYSVDRRVDNKIIKIYYQRPSDSNLPKSKKFQFDQTDPTRLEQAITELNSLTGGKTDSRQRQQQLGHELQQLEQVMTSKLDELRQQLRTWQ